MKTLADAKRRTTTGTRLEVTGQTRRPELVGQIRTVTRAGTTRYMMTLSDDEGTEQQGREYPVYWPKASTVRIIDDDSYEYDLPSGGTVRLRFMNG